MSTDERLTDLEARITYLERHLEHQDREMLKQSEHIALLTRELKSLKNQVDDSSDGGSLPAQERPPHY